MEIVDPLEILELALIPDSSPAVYGIGLASSRITFADQQRRACNLVWALLAEKRIAPKDRIAVVGGGIAGITAAAFAVQHDVGVSVFETFDAPFALQQGSSRWIHPNIYEWPNDGWHVPQTDLPCMNWRAASAGEVIGQLRNQWHDLLKDMRVQWLPLTEVAKLDGPSTTTMVVDSKGTSHGPFKAVIAAIGFGEETTYDVIGGKGYWLNEDVHQRLRNGGVALVSGCGDGGLIDASRVLLLDYKHEWLAEIAKVASNRPNLVAELIRQERNSPAFPDGRGLSDALLGVDPGEEVTKMIRDRIRPHTRVILNARNDGPFTRKSCLLNRFVVAQFIRLGVAEYRPGAFDGNDVTRDGKKYKARIDGKGCVADIVVVRHGPKSSPVARFPSLEARLRPVRGFLQTYSAAVDRSRRKAWRKIDYAEPTGPAPLPVVTGRRLDYFAERGQSALMQEFKKQSVSPIVEWRHRPSGVEFEVGLAGKSHRIQVDMSTHDRLLVTCQVDGSADHSTEVLLKAPPMDDVSGAVEALTSKVDQVVGWVLEGTA